MTDHADIVRTHIAEWAGSPGLHGETAALAALDRLTERVAYLVAEAHGWQPKLAAAVEERDTIRNAAEWLLANRGHRGEQQAWKLLAEALAKEPS